MTPHGGSRTLRLLPRLAIAAGLTGYMLWKSHPSEVLAAAAGADWRPMALAVVLVLIDRTLMAYRWVALLCIVDPRQRPPLGALIQVFFVSTFLGTFLPASIGSDVLRSYGAAQLNVGTADAVASVVVDRVFGVASILTMAVVGLLLIGSPGGGAAVALALGAAAAVCLVAGLLIFSRSSVTFFAGVLARLPSGTLNRIGARGLGSIQKYASHPGQLLNVFLCSIAVQGIRTVQAYYLGLGLGLRVSLTTYVALIPLILLIMLLPVTFNGVGTSQAAFVWSFGSVGVEAPAAFALSILFVALGIVGNLPGGLLYIRGMGLRPQRRNL